MNILLINNTASEFHIGCHGVTSSIKKSIIDRFGKTCSITSIYTSDLKKPLDKNLTFFDKNWDAILVNGEGSLHKLNVEGENIFQALRLFVEQGYSNKIEVLNASIYDLKDDWLKILAGLNRIEVRDLSSFEYLKSRGIESTFKLDRLFDYLNTMLNIDNKIKKRRKDELLIFDAVDRNHASIIKLLGNSKLDYIFGAVDLSPFVSLNDKVISFNSSSLIASIFRFYCKVLYRAYRYRFMKGKKYITDIESYISDILNSDVRVITARYHIVVICLFLGKDFTYISSNTRKIESLISVFEKRFDDEVKVVRDESNITTVELNYTREDVVRFIDEFNYTVD